MPYIICQNIPGCLPEEDPVAVATHFEARETAAHYVEQITGGDDAYEEVYTDAQNVSELGDVFGPLPGGYIVEVQPRSVELLLDDLGEHELRGSIEDLIQRYNDSH